MTSNDSPMPNFLSAPVRQELLSRLRRQRLWLHGWARESPAVFRALIALPTRSPLPSPLSPLSPPTPGSRTSPPLVSSTPPVTAEAATTSDSSGGSTLPALGPALTGTRFEPWQERDFAALDPAWQRLAGVPVRPAPMHLNCPDNPDADAAASTVSTTHPEFWRAYLERPRGHSKTTDLAIQVAWILQFARLAVKGLAAAADREQAELLRDAVRDLLRRQPELCPDLVVQQQRILNRLTGSQLMLISSDVGSSWGQLPDFVICDELCHWPKADLWYSLSSSAAKKPRCLLVVLTNAGFGTGWTWQVRETARTSPHWHFQSLTGCMAPWITGPMLEEQRRLLPPTVYARLWENRWQHSDGEFVTLAEADACCDSGCTEQWGGRPGVRYFAAVDYAEKHDLTVGVILHREHDLFVIDRLDLAVPSPGHPVPVAWVEHWMEQMAERFTGVEFTLDEYQLLSVIQRTSDRWPVRRFDFAGTAGHHALAMLLRQSIVQRTVRWFPGCGQRPDRSTRDDLAIELSQLILRSQAAGRLRIDHRREADHHDDRAFAVGAALLQAARHSSSSEWYAVTPPDRSGQFAW
jgi:hypothetical protein